MKHHHYSKYLGIGQALSQKGIKGAYRFRKTTASIYEQRLKYKLVLDNLCWHLSIQLPNPDDFSDGLIHELDFLKIIP